MSELYQSLSHSKWDCKYHVVFVPKRRRKAIFGQARRQLGVIFHALARQKECQIIEGHLMPDHVHMCLSFPPKYSIAMAVGYIKGKSAIKINRDLFRHKRPFTGLHFWAPGYCVSTIGLNEAEIREYVRNQEELEQEKDGQLNLPEFE